MNVLIIVVTGVGITVALVQAANILDWLERRSDERRARRATRT
jgi:hypothetical protein